MQWAWQYPNNLCNTGGRKGWVFKIIIWKVNIWLRHRIYNDCFVQTLRMYFKADHPSAKVDHPSPPNHSESHQINFSVICCTFSFPIEHYVYACTTAFISEKFQFVAALAWRGWLFSRRYKDSGWQIWRSLASITIATISTKMKNSAELRKNIFVNL